jgi:phosphoglycerol transferase MdoB-like AlkP superfamily enzyme
MLNETRLAITYWIKWILFFELARVLFMLYHFRETIQLDFSDMFLSLVYGLRMDASMAAYLIIPVCLLLLLGIFFQPLRKAVWFRVYTGIILVPVLLIIFSDLPAYSAWGFRLDGSPLKYLSTPREAWASVSHLPVIWISIFFILSYLLTWRWFNRSIRHFLQDHHQPTNKKSSLWLVALMGLLILPLRGGWQLAPLNQSSVYFSTQHFANLSAINVVWNFMHSLSHQTNSTTNPFAYLNSSTADSLVRTQFKAGKLTETMIRNNSRQPVNVVLVVCESFTGKAIGLTYDGQAVTPGFQKLIQEGVYFSNIYASGDRTDKGIVAVLSGYPAQPTTSIIKIPQKAAKLPNLVTRFKKDGYHTAFFYGGELEFANMKAYLMGSGFDQYVSKDDFDTKDQNSKWGAHDHVVANRVVKDLSAAKQPFFYTWLTLSSHEPYEIPAAPAFPENKDVAQFLSSVHYTDSVLYDFVQRSKKEPWWKNTVIVFVADHGHRLPYSDKKINDFKIPLLLVGGALNHPGQTIQALGSQTDIPLLLLNQLNLSDSSFTWSKDFLQHAQNEWAYFSFNNGFGYVRPDAYFIYDNVGRRLMEQQGRVNDSMIRIGEAIQQMSFADYLKR